MASTASPDASGLVSGEIRRTAGALVSFVEERSEKINQAGKIDDHINIVGESGITFNVSDDEGVATKLEPGNTELINSAVIRAVLCRCFSSRRSLGHIVIEGSFGNRNDLGAGEVGFSTTCELDGLALGEVDDGDCSTGVCSGKAAKVELIYTFSISVYRKRSINRVRQDKGCFQEAGAGEQFHGSSAS